MLISTSRDLENPDSKKIPLNSTTTKKTATKIESKNNNLINLKKKNKDINQVNVTKGLKNVTFSLSISLNVQNSTIKHHKSINNYIKS